MTMAKKGTHPKSNDSPSEYRMGKLTSAPKMPAPKTSGPKTTAPKPSGPKSSQSPLSPTRDWDELPDLMFDDAPEMEGISSFGTILHEQQQILIRGIAHDLNNNLMAILSACDTIENRAVNTADLDWAFNSIRMQVKSSAMLMRDLVNSHSSEVSEVMDQNQLKSFLKSILPSLALVAGEKSNIELGSVITPPVHIHRMFLHRVLMQFIRNISELDVERPLAFISVRRVDAWCEISVADNGPGLIGISADEIFRPGMTTKGEKGTRGFGLSTVAWAVQQWGGEYGVESISNDSCCRFWIRIPLKDG